MSLSCKRLKKNGLDQRRPSGVWMADRPWQPKRPSRRRQQDGGQSKGFSGDSVRRELGTNFFSIDSATFPSIRARTANVLSLGGIHQNLTLDTNVLTMF